MGLSPAQLRGHAKHMQDSSYRQGSLPLMIGSKSSNDIQGPSARCTSSIEHCLLPDGQPTKSFRSGPASNHPRPLKSAKELKFSETRATDMNMSKSLRFTWYWPRPSGGKVAPATLPTIGVHLQAGNFVSSTRVTSSQEEWSCVRSLFRRTSPVSSFSQDQ